MNPLIRDEILLVLAVRLKVTVLYSKVSIFSSRTLCKLQVIDLHMALGKRKKKALPAFSEKILIDS